MLILATVSFGLAVWASIYQLLAWRHRPNHVNHLVWWGYVYLCAPVVFAFIPLLRRTRKAALVSAILLLVFTLNPLIFGSQMLYIPATVAMLVSLLLTRPDSGVAPGGPALTNAPPGGQ
jgi:hypothetical protein